MRLKRLFLAIAAVFALAAPATAATASTTVTHTHAARAVPLDFSAHHFLNYSTGNDSGGNGNGALVDNGTYNTFNGTQVGTVSNSSEWPFTPGLGLNATYDGRPVWIFYETGSPSTCWQMSSVYVILNQTCGTSHPYSMFVSTANAPNGFSGWHGLVNVGDSDSTGAGAYVWASTGNQDVVDPYAASGHETWNF